MGLHSVRCRCAVVADVGTSSVFRYAAAEDYLQRTLAANKDLKRRAGEAERLAEERRRDHDHVMEETPQTPTPHHTVHGKDLGEP